MAEGNGKLTIAEAAKRAARIRNLYLSADDDLISTGKVAANLELAQIEEARLWYLTLSTIAEGAEDAEDPQVLARAALRTTEA